MKNYCMGKKNIFKIFTLNIKYCRYKLSKYTLKITYENFLKRKGDDDRKSMDKSPQSDKKVVLKN